MSKFRPSNKSSLFATGVASASALVQHTKYNALLVTNTSANVQWYAIEASATAPSAVVVPIDANITKGTPILPNTAHCLNIDDVTATQNVYFSAISPAGTSSLILSYGFDD